MAGVEKYAHLPDVDLGTEIYETTLPELTEGSTLQTESHESSENEDSRHFDRRALNPDTARQRFEPVLVDARNVNFSDTAVNGHRSAYKTSQRRRRRRHRRRSARGSDAEDSEYSDVSAEETLQSRLARLRREAEEVKAELEQLEKQDSGRHLNVSQPGEEDDDEDGHSSYEDAVDQETSDTNKLSLESRELEDLLRGLPSNRNERGLAAERAFLSRLAAEPESSQHRRQLHDDADPEALAPSTISAIATFSDRLTTLELLLGLSTNTTTNPLAMNHSPVLPTLASLSTQIDVLFSSLSPQQAFSNSSTGPHTNVTTNMYLESLTTKVRELVADSKKLESANRAASRSFEELLQQRDRHGHVIHQQQAEARLVRTNSGRDVPAADIADSNSRNAGSQQGQFSTLFLDSQSSRITALHALLPTITSLQPLLPVVLERLRALSRIHAGAAEARSEIDEVESRLTELEKDVKTWTSSVEGVERAMKEEKEAMADNVQTIASMIKNIEERCAGLERTHLGQY